ncbi:hypothetical protein [Chitinophaga rhizophila]|uniref:Uncharacterized protein n=1 Tax=Chitinophaga rhizophila TaxID=2866212 RepID=A0ABS7GLK6_9BACT|nr:hypothetical protein [Chitinophaga rhizophila]MBW8687557.1 hypothetical protein [Chitinophaga rhizophila]
MRKSIYTLLSLLIAAFLIVAILVLTAPAPNKQPNGFKRQYLEASPLPVTATLPTGNNNILDIAGADDSLYYFSVLRDPSTIIASSLQANAIADTFRIELSPSFKDSVSEYFFTQYSNNRFFVYGYNIPSVCETGRAGNIRLPRQRSYNHGGFSQAQVLRDNQHFVLRKLHIQEKDQLFVRVTLDNDSLHMEKGLSTLHRDGGMSTDGAMTYDRTTGLLTYVYYYSNRFFTFDSTLQLVSSGHTLDTFSVSKFSIATNKDEKSQVYMNAGPDQMVNGFSCADNGVLYVQAKLKADNDDERMFGKYTVIDMYEIKSGRYKGSSYLDIPARTKINQLFVKGDQLLVHGETHIYLMKIAY